MNFFDFMQDSAQVIYSSFKLILKWFIQSTQASNHARIFLFLTLLIVLTTTVLTFISVILVGIKPSLSGFDSSWFTLFFPPNTIGCLAAILSARAAVFVFRWKVVGISAISQMKAPTGIDLNYTPNPKPPGTNLPPDAYY